MFESVCESERVCEGVSELECMFVCVVDTKVGRQTGGSRIT